jgi:hypothetical protein
VHIPLSQITPTKTACSSFASGTAATQYELQYSAKNTTISAVNPRAFLYWVPVTVSSSGTQTFTIRQTHNDTKYLMLRAGSTAYDPGCNALTTSSSAPSPDITVVSFNAPSTLTYPTGGLTFFVKIKFWARSLLGAPTPTTTCYEADPRDAGTVQRCSTYSFETFVGPPPPAASVPYSSNSIIVEPKDTS